MENQEINKKWSGDKIFYKIFFVTFSLSFFVDSVMQIVNNSYDIYYSIATLLMYWVFPTAMAGLIIYVIKKVIKKLKK